MRLDLETSSICLYFSFNHHLFPRFDENTLFNSLQNFNFNATNSVLLPYILHVFVFLELSAFGRVYPMSANDGDHVYF
jgi:hypothetical protein